MLSMHQSKDAWIVRTIRHVELKRFAQCIKTRWQILTSTALQPGNDELRLQVIRYGNKFQVRQARRILAMDRSQISLTRRRTVGTGKAHTALNGNYEILSKMPCRRNCLHSLGVLKYTLFFCSVAGIIRRDARVQKTAKLRDVHALFSLAHMATAHCAHCFSQERICSL